MPKSIRGYFSSVVRGLFISLIISIFCCALVSLIMRYWDIIWLDSHFKWFMVGITIFSIFTGGVVGAYRAQGKGLLIGIVVGILYVACGYIISWSLGDATLNVYMVLSKLAAGMLAGAVGGVLGIQL